LIKRKTLFVVGAGASCKYGLPLGAQLVRTIANALDGCDLSGSGANQRDGMFAHAFRLMIRADRFEKPQELDSKMRRMAEALVLAPSIDAYIETNKTDPDIAFIGKLAIAAQLLEAEGGSNLAQWKEGKRFEFDDDVRKSLLGQLFPILVEGADAREVSKIFENVSFIVFNYDRCIEHFLAMHLHGYFGMSLREAESIIAKCAIVHPYGTLGMPAHPTTPIPYGCPWHKGSGAGAELLVHVADNLRTYSEFQADTEEVRLAKKLVSEAEQAVFLGFAFHAQNVELLRIHKGEIAVNQVRCSAFELSDDNKMAVRWAIARIFRKADEYMNDRSIGLIEGDCGKLIADTSMLLAR
jgi:hypothetical protein